MVSISHFSMKNTWSKVTAFQTSHEVFNLFHWKNISLYVEKLSQKLCCDSFVITHNMWYNIIKVYNKYTRSTSMTAFWFFSYLGFFHGTLMQFQEFGSSSHIYSNRPVQPLQPAITCSKLITETLEQGVKYVQN